MRAELEISTWKGRSANATHVYGTLWLDGARYEITRVLSEGDVQELNETDISIAMLHGIDLSNTSCQYKAGQETTRFGDKEEVIKHLAAFIEKNCPDVDEVWQDDEDNIVWHRKTQ